MKLTSTLAAVDNLAGPRVVLDSLAPVSRVPPPTSGALAFVPFESPAGSDKLVGGFRAVAQKQGPVAAIRWLEKNRGPLQALVKTPAGRAALAAATVGFTVGFTAGWGAGTSASKVQALATALKAVSDQHLPADQTARQVCRVLQAAFSDGKVAMPTSSGKRIKSDWPVSLQPDSLAQAQAKLRQAKVALRESQAILAQNRSNPGQREIVEARQASVAKIQGQVNALMRALVNGVNTAGSTVIRKPEFPTLPNEIDHSRAGVEKQVARQGDVMHEQRVDGYRNGGTSEAATRGLNGDALARVQAALDDIDRSKLPPGGVTGGRTSTASDAGSPDGSRPTRALRRSKTERVRDISQKILKERFDGQNVSARFITRVRRTGGFTEVATPARDSDRLADGSPATVGDVKRLLGGLNNSVVSIKNGLGGLIDVKVESKGFRAINMKLLTSPKGIKEIGIVEISASGTRTPERACPDFCVRGIA